MNGKTPPILSVVIPVLNNEHGLELCLNALALQHVSREYFEIIVVDNGSTDESYAIAGRLADTAIQVQKRSAYRARQKGIEVASGSIIAFTDSDCIPDAHWLEQGMKEINNNYDLVAGHIDIPTHTLSSLSHVIDSICNLRHELSVPRRQVAFMANLFVKKEVLTKVAINPNHTSGEDSIFTKTAVSLGYKLTYCPNCIVEHSPRTFKGLLKKSYRIGHGKAVSNTLKSGGGSPHFDMLIPSHLWKALKKKNRAGLLPFLQATTICYSIILFGMFGFIAGSIPFNTVSSQNQ